MEIVLLDLLNSDKVPNIIKYIIVALACLFVIGIGVWVGIQSELLFGKIFGFVLAVVMAIAGIFISMKIHNGSINENS